MANNPYSKFSSTSPTFLYQQVLLTMFLQRLSQGITQQVCLEWNSKVLWVLYGRLNLSKSPISINNFILAYLINFCEVFFSIQFSSTFIQSYQESWIFNLLLFTFLPFVSLLTFSPKEFSSTRKYIIELKNLYDKDWSSLEKVFHAKWQIQLGFQD